MSTNSRLTIFTPYQASVDDVERLLKKHEDTEKSLLAQEEKMRAIAEMAKSLIRAEHYEKAWYEQL